MRDVKRVGAYCLAQIVFLLASCDAPDGRSRESERTTPSAFTEDTNTALLAAHAAERMDVSAPETFIDMAPPAITNMPIATFGFSSPQPDVSFECNLDLEPYTPCSSPFTLPLLANGVHSFRVRAVDSLGNADPSPAVHTWEVDTVPPSVELLSAPPSISNQPGATFQFSSSEHRASFECSLDSSFLFEHCTNPISFDTLFEGSHTLRVRALDPAGNQSAPLSYSWVIDLTPPQIALIISPPAVTHQTRATFQFSSDESAVYECALDGIDFSSCSNPKTLENLGVGPHRLDARARDLAGNASSILTYAWRILAVAPTTVITSLPPAFTNQRSAEFRMSSDTADVTYQCSMDGAGFTPCPARAVYLALSEGPHLFQTRAVDAAGTEDPAGASYTWQIDITKPDSVILSAPPPLTPQQRATFRFSSSEEGVAYACSLDSAPYAPCSSPHTYVNLPEGPHSFTVRAQDAASNVEEPPSHYSWAVDRSSMTPFESGPPSFTRSSSVIFILSSPPLGSPGYGCSLDYAEFSDCSSPLLLPPLSEGPHTLRVRLRGAEGSIEETISAWSWAVDTTPPSAPEILQPGKNASIRSQQVFITGATEAGSQVTVSIDDAVVGNLLSREGSWSLVSAGELAPGVHTIVATATDTAGNTSPASSSVSFTTETQGYYGWGCAASSQVAPSALLALAVFFSLLKSLSHAL